MLSYFTQGFFFGRSSDCALVIDQHLIVGVYVIELDLIYGRAHD
jgi:hypothetical protein